MTIPRSTRLLLFAFLAAGGCLVIGCSDPAAATTQRLRDIGAKGIISSEADGRRNEGPDVVVLEDTTISAALLQETLRLSSLEAIALRRIQVPDLPDSFQFASLESLNHVEFTGLSDETLVRSLVPLLTHATTIQLDGIPLPDEVLTSLAANKEIEHLALCDTRLLPDALDRIHPPRLTTLDLSETDFGDASLSWLGKFSSLVNLRLSKTSLTRLPHDGLFHELAMLDLDAIKFSGDLAADVASLPKLVSLSLRHGKIDSTAAGRLASRRELGALNLQNAEIAEPDLFRSFEKLRVGILNVSGTPFSDRCLDQLLETSGTSLNSLGVVDTSLTTAAHDRLPGFSKLATLRTNSSLLSEQTAATLRARPRPVRIAPAHEARHGWPRLHSVVTLHPL